MKKMLGILALLGCFALGGAGKAQAQVPSFNVRLSSVPTIGVDISSSAPTTIVNVTENWIGVCVQNLDTTANVYCSANVNVSSVTTNANIGNVVAAAASATSVASPTCFALAIGQPYYCMGGKTTGICRTVITRMR